MPDRQLPPDPADPRRQHDPGRGLRGHVEAAGVPTQPPMPDPVAEAAEDHTETDACEACGWNRERHFQPFPIGQRIHAFVPSQPDFTGARRAEEVQAYAQGETEHPPEGEVPEYDADGVHRDDVHPDITRALLRMNKGPSTGLFQMKADPSGLADILGARKPIDEQTKYRRPLHFRPLTLNEPLKIAPLSEPEYIDRLIDQVEALAASRLAEHRPGTGPAYRQEGEQNAFRMVLNLLKRNDPEGAS